VSGEEDVTLKSCKKVTQPYNRSFKRHSELRRNKSSSIKNCSQKQLSSSSHHVNGKSYEKDSKNDTYISRIPTLVNGQICLEEEEERNKHEESDNKSRIQLSLSEATCKLIATKKRFSNSNEHKVLLIGDSHIRGCAEHIKIFLQQQFEVCGYVKPGASTKLVLESVKSDIEKFTMDDFVIVSSGSNNASINDFRKVFCEVTDFVKSVNQTNVVLLGIPYRYDLGNSQINNEIEIHNRKLGKLAKKFPHVNVIKVDSNRHQYSTHGRHLNGLAKELLSAHLLLHIYSTLEKDRSSAIALAWGDNNPQVKTLDANPVNQDMRASDSIRGKLISFHCPGKDSLTSGAVNGNTKGNESKVLKIRTSTRTKKAPATKKDFLW
jgi:hypothetical protein